MTISRTSLFPTLHRPPDWNPPDGTCDLRLPEIFPAREPRTLTPTNKHVTSINATTSADLYQRRLCPEFPNRNDWRGVC